MKKTPRKSRPYLFWAAFFLLLPSLLKLYSGETGKLLASSAKAADPAFSETVIYISSHTLEGAHGYAVNVALNAAERGKLPIYLRDKNIPVFKGGPLEYPERITVLEKTGNTKEPIKAIRFDEAVAEDPLYLEKLAADQENRYRVIAGYSGWGMLQLENEFRRGDWASTGLNLDWIFTPNMTPHEIWLKTIQAAENKRKPRDPGVI